MIQIGKWKKDRSNLGFRDYKKIDGTPNVTLLFFITVTITNHSILGVVIDDGISCDLMYIGTFMKLGLQIEYLKSSECKSLLSLNYSSICLCGRMNLPVSLREWKTWVLWTCTPLWKRLHNILGRSFLVVLVVVAFMVHLNIKYHNDMGKLVVVKVNLHGS